MNAPSWLKTIAFYHIAALASVPSAAQDTKTPAYVDVRAATAEAKQKTDSANSLQEGEYVTAKGWGQLIISQQVGKSTSFNIQSVTGENVCDLSGKVFNENGIAVDYRGNTSCVVKFAESDGAIAVSTNTPEECRHFCGVNGGFEGLYLKAKEGCRSGQIEFTRIEFKQLYDQKQYKTALSKLSPILEDCLSVLEWQEEGGIRNDIAITQHKLGLNSSCLRTLESYIVDARKDDNEVVENWPPPSVANQYLAIIKAARTNIHLCNSGLQRTSASVSDHPIQKLKTDFSGEWSVKWCDKTAPEAECGGFSADLIQEGDRVNGESSGARVRLAQVDEGGVIHGIAIGDTAILTIESLRSGAIYLVQASIHGNCMRWKIRDTVRPADGDIDIVALDDVLTRDSAAQVCR
ncbi:hypothetical protein [Pseudoxanthomonas sp. CF125]|uniref:hypothetical protein n=1 Tax=Pseudoxanthomonas sp. CF125 TaxID=1855303 RepID=UPI0008818198|nr:hypothetical protein [Pseudoxanthomonas sp. CF125]SDQ58077.1 hypothetical protein SAMN05216569_1673 [Pseudoxanthomonas sp. CF125]